MAKANRLGKGCCKVCTAVGLTGHRLQLVLTDGCPGLAAALQIVYPRVLHQHCWVHKMRNILEKVKKRDYEAVKADAQ